jgi:hypothetical protein
MPVPRNEIAAELDAAWGGFARSLEKSIRKLDAGIKAAKQLAAKCAVEWCAATQHVIDELSNALFSTSEPRGSDVAVSNKIKQLQHSVHDLYADYRQVFRSVH